MTDLVIRALAEGEEQLFESLADPGLVSFAAAGKTYTEMRYRPECSWIALRDGVVVARAAWWIAPDDAEPLALDWFDFTDTEAAIALLRAAPFNTQYVIRVPPDFEQRPDVRHEATRRVEAAKAAGMVPLVDRYRYRWTTECGVPDRPGRLAFRPEPDDKVIFDVLREIAHGSLDAHAVRDIERSGYDAAAQGDLDNLLWLPGPREWWRLGYTESGQLAGFVAPSRNYYDPAIAFVGVVPEQRGHGYAYDLLVEGTHLLVDQGADRIVANTDVTNTPMAANFKKAGYPVEWYQIDLDPRP
ncbi:MAG TPA: GNAT family N-acetyltransferase [Pseudonocardiaceae bacterium]|jgi:RimJ/RimL family protein N-acetyltransferase